MKWDLVNRRDRYYLMYESHPDECGYMQSFILCLEDSKNVWEFDGDVYFPRNRKTGYYTTYYDANNDVKSKYRTDFNYLEVLRVYDAIMKNFDSKYGNLCIKKIIH